MRKDNSIKSAVKLIKPIIRTCSNPRNSICSSALLQDLDWTNWWQDNGYIHVKHSSAETWHRVFPRKIRERRCTRIAVSNGIPQWFYD